MGSVFEGGPEVSVCLFYVQSFGWLVSGTGTPVRVRPPEYREFLSEPRVSRPRSYLRGGEVRPVCVSAVPQISASVKSVCPRFPTDVVTPVGLGSPLCAVGPPVDGRTHQGSPNLGIPTPDHPDVDRNVLF